MELVKPTAARPVVTFGEAMVELSGVDGDTCRLGVAGDTFNTAVYLARAGHPCAYMSALGDDHFSGRIRAAVVDEGISDHLIALRRGVAPGLYAVNVDEHGERDFTYWRSAAAVRQFFHAPNCDEVLAQVENAALFYLSAVTLSLFTEAERGRIAQLAERVRSAGGAVAFDTNYRPAGWSDRGAARRAVEQIAPYASIALPTYEDDALLFDDPSPEDSAARWAAYGVAEIVVKHGAEGAYLNDVGWVAPPRPVKPVDTTGAGDSFNGGYLAARLGGEGRREAAIAGHTLAGQVLTTPGAILPRG